MTQKELIMEFRNQLLSDKELYNAFVASIASALKDIPVGIGVYAVAEVVTERIIGREEG